MKISKLLKKKKKSNSVALPPSTTIPSKKRQQQPKSQDPKLDVTPPSPPTRSFVINTNGEPVEDDDISAMTRGTDMPESPDRGSSPYTKTYVPPPAAPISLLSAGFKDDDSSSQDLFVFEDKTDDSMEGDHPSPKFSSSTGGLCSGGASGGGSGSVPSSPNGKLRVRFSEETTTMSAAGNATKLFDDNNLQKNKKNKLQDDITTTTTTTTTGKKLRSSAVSNLVKRKASYLTNTEYFRNAVDSSFDKIDVDKSGDVTLEELYAGLLLIHLKMAIYVGAPACRVSLLCVPRYIFLCLSFHIFSS